MRHVLMFVLALIIGWVIWRLITGVVVTLLGMVFHLAMIALLCFIVYSVYKAMTGKERI